ncbi:MAG: O-antigen ligase family protein [Oscillospiraceae bacterium]|nr:O-antigen ligase family protein [Oscillospiraceae bacterium]
MSVKKHGGDPDLTAAYAEISVWQERTAEALVVVLMCVLPLFLTSERYFYLTRQKFVFFVASTCLIMYAVAAVWGARLLRDPRLPSRSGVFSVADCALLGFAGVTLLSAFLSPYREVANVWLGIQERFDGAVTQLLYVLVFFIVSRWYRPRTRDLALFAASSVIVAGIGILQFFGMDIFTLWPVHDERFIVENYYDIFFRSTLGNVNIVSTYVCAAVLLNGYFFVRTESTRPYLWLAASALNFWLMDLAGSYSGRVGVAAALVLTLPFVFENKKYSGRFLILCGSWVLVYAAHRLFYNLIALGNGNPSRLLLYAAGLCLLLLSGFALLIWEKKKPGQNSGRNRKLGLIAALLCVVLGVAGVEIAGRSGGGMIYELREIMHGNIQDSFATYRIHIWRNAMSVYSRHPFFGSGPDTFSFVFPEAAQGVVGEFYDKAHNEYLQILICQGIFGLACYLVFLAAIFVKAVKKAFSDPIIMAVSAAFAGYAAQAFFNISLPIASQMLWIFAGIIAGAASRKPDVSL